MPYKILARVHSWLLQKSILTRGYPEDTDTAGRGMELIYLRLWGLLDFMKESSGICIF
jgi:hypothetical protein